MSSRRKKSRFTKTDVNTICEMQRDLSFAEQIACAIIGMTRNRDNNPCFKHIPVLINDCGSRFSSIFDVAWNAVDDKMQEFDALQAENKSLKEELEKLKEK